MPYLPPLQKEDLDAGFPMTIGGDLNYKITKLCDSYLTQNGLNYSRINEVIGALECAKLELYRRVAAPYEDIKIEQNGDVYSETNLSR